MEKYDSLEHMDSRCIDRENKICGNDVCAQEESLQRVDNYLKLLYKFIRHLCADWSKYKLLCDVDG